MPTHSENFRQLSSADLGFALYIHWPFCQAKCPYCDFNSHVVSQVDQDAWKVALLAEISRYAQETSGNTLRSIFFGGGTPSLMPPPTVEAVINAALGHWRTVNDIEITLEANPTSAEADRFRDFRAAGVNRVSIGVQALRDSDLHRLGRLHSVAEARRAVELAQRQFDRSSFDLIYARQDQTAQEWEGELSEALRWGSDHLSLYQLTIEDGTAFGDRAARGRLPGLPEEDVQADMFEITQSLCDNAGLPAYEISNHARAGQESRHNLVYWRGGDWVGVGPGAHGRLTIDGHRVATEAITSPVQWAKRVSEEGTGESVRHVLSTADDTAERLMMGLRTTEGIPSYLIENKEKLGDMFRLGMVETAQGHTRVTRKGRPMLNAILRELIMDSPA